GFLLKKLRPSFLFVFVIARTRSATPRIRITRCRAMSGFLRPLRHERHSPPDSAESMDGPHLQFWLRSRNFRARVGFVRAVWVSSFAVVTRKQTFPSGKFAATRTARASARSFGR